MLRAAVTLAHAPSSLHDVSLTAAAAASSSPDAAVYGALVVAFITALGGFLSGLAAFITAMRRNRDQDSEDRPRRRRRR